MRAISTSLKSMVFTPSQRLMAIDGAAVSPIATIVAASLRPIRMKQMIA